MIRVVLLVILAVVAAAPARPQSVPGERGQESGAGGTFDQAYARLRAGRTYQRQPTGRVAMPAKDGGITLDNVVEVPADYDPARPIPLRVSLHGGVGREAPGPGDPPARGLSNRTPAGREIVIHPRAWSASAWWRPQQVDNVLRLVERVKRDYNVDESRVYVTGISDGGTGVFYFGMREATLWAACLSLNGHPSVIANPQTGADGQLYSGNLANCPLYMVNGGKDPLYPAASVAPIVEMFKRGAIPLVFQVHPDAGHNVEWWPIERPRYEAFLAAHPRAAHPAKISWETERTDRYNRFRWLIVDRLGKRGSDTPIEDVNTLQPALTRGVELFERTKPSGRVDIERKGNAFEAKSRGVQQFTLLLSPDAVDFAKPIHVIVNGRTVHDAIVRTDMATLQKWAAKDNDRTMLYGAELKITVP